MILETVTQLVESLHKPGLMGVVGMKRERVCTRELAAYFRLLATSLPIDDLANLATQAHQPVALHTAEMKIRRTLRSLQPLLLEILSTNLLLAYKEGWNNLHIHSVDGLKEAKTKVKISGSPMDKLGPSGERAADYAATSSGSLIKGLNKTTLDLLQEAIATGIEDQLGVDGLGRLLRSTVMDMSVSRAKSIATTEMNDAFSTAALEKMDSLGIKYKKWMPVDDPCPICSDNAEEGAIPVDDSFSSGDDAPPAHPNCRCAIVGARPPDSGGD